jgi:hypothetical protein
MKTFFLCGAAALCTSLTHAQSENYILIVNGDTTSITLNKSQVINTKAGPLQVTLKQKENQTYSNNFYSFQYPSAYGVSSKKIDAGIEQLMCISPMGNGFMIQKYASANPELISDFMLAELTEESKAAGYKEVIRPVTKTLADGRVLKGKEATLTLDEEVNIYTVFPAAIRNGGILIITMVVNPNEEADLAMLNKLWSSLTLVK